MTRWTKATPRGDSRKARVEVFMRQDGICGCGCGRKLETKGWTLEHIVPLVDGGADKLDNMAAYSNECAKAKTKKEATERATIRRKRDKFINAMPKSKRPMPGSRDSGWKKTFNNGWVRR